MPNYDIKIQDIGQQSRLETMRGENPDHVVRRVVANRFPDSMMAFAVTVYPHPKGKPFYGRYRRVSDHAGRLNELRTGSIPSLWSGVVTIMPRKEIIVKLEEAD